MLKNLHPFLNDNEFIVYQTHRYDHDIENYFYYLVNSKNEESKQSLAKNINEFLKNKLPDFYYKALNSEWTYFEIVCALGEYSSISYALRDKFCTTTLLDNSSIEYSIFKNNCALKYLAEKTARAFEKPVVNLPGTAHALRSLISRSLYIV